MAAPEAKCRRNERVFENWEDLPDGGRRYWYEVTGRLGWKARYVKEVDADENTNERGELVEIHEKYPVDTGHRKVKEP
jgi:hypothetical protein